jgi:hypothetical protein
MSKCLHPFAQIIGALKQVEVRTTVAPMYTSSRIRSVPIAGNAPGRASYVA